jgi:hypothetical protein
MDLLGIRPKIKVPQFIAGSCCNFYGANPERISSLRRILSIAVLSVALVLGFAPSRVPTSAAQSIGITIDIGSVVFKKNKGKGKSKRERLRERRERFNQEYRIKPSEAVQLAVRAHPGSKALSVRALPGRPIYVVTLRGKTQVRRVRVNAITGAVAGGD